MHQTLKTSIDKALKELEISEAPFVVEHSANADHGDYSTNIAMIAGKQVGENPRELAEKIRSVLLEQNIENVEKIEVAGAGFINFFLKPEYFIDQVKKILDEAEKFGRNNALMGRKVMIEYTDPNVMKPFHIGHLMSNAIGESISRLVEFSGAEVKRANYYSDSGIALAKALWGMNDLMQEMPSADSDIIEKTDFLGKSYVHGVREFESRAEVKEEITRINKAIYERNDKTINDLYDAGKRWSLQHFEILYKKLGSSFDFFIAETSIAHEGLKIVRDNVGKVFEESEGAIIFRGEKFDENLHTRVFINKKGLPTYEAKELGLAKRKFEEENPDFSIVVTGNEIKDYYRVVMKALSLINEDWAAKTLHIPHGMLRLSTGKMSSRTGNVITGESLIHDVEELAREKMKTSTHLSPNEQDEVATQIAVGAIKYSILKQQIGKDIIFDFDKSLSFEGDSGPYLQYTYARAKSVLSKAKDVNLKASLSGHSAVSPLEKLLEKFPGEVERAFEEYAPQRIVTYLIELASAFNSYYANNKIVDEGDKDVSGYRLALTTAVATVLKNGLWLLGIKSPERM